MNSSDWMWLSVYASVVGLVILGAALLKAVADNNDPDPPPAI